MEVSNLGGLVTKEEYLDIKKKWQSGDGLFDDEIKKLLEHIEGDEIDWFR